MPVVNKERRRLWIENNKAAIAQHGRNFYEKRRNKYLNIVLKAKDKPCLDCGQRFHFSVMDFDHRDPSKKVIRISQMCSWAPSKIEAEIAKCDLVCANCHRVRTWRQQHAG